MCFRLTAAVDDHFDLVKTLSHSAMDVPDKGQTTGYSYPIATEVLSEDDEIRCWTYLFEYEWEMVTGEWTMSISHNDRVLFNRSFEVFDTAIPIE